MTTLINQKFSGQQALEVSTEKGLVRIKQSLCTVQVCVGALPELIATLQAELDYLRPSTSPGPTQGQLFDRNDYNRTEVR